MASAAQRRIKSISYAKYGYMFIAPFFLVYCFFQVWPLIYTFILSFKGNQAAFNDWVGLDNYTTILFGQGSAAGSMNSHQEFAKALGNTFILWFGNFIPQILLSAPCGLVHRCKGKAPWQGILQGCYVYAEYHHRCFCCSSVC